MRGRARGGETVPIEHKISEADKITEARFVGDVTDDDYVDFYVSLARTTPEAAYYDEVIDMLDYDGSISNDSVRKLAALVEKRGDAPATEDGGPLTVLVTRDLQFEAWLKFIRSKFPFRTYKIVRSVEEAYRALADWRS